MQHTIHFGLHFDGPVLHPDPAPGAQYLGPRGILVWLEQQLGVEGYPGNTDYLRIELYRQALLQYLSEHQTIPFYAASFEADRFATAAVLLAHRDNLLLAGWDFQEPSAPDRLRVFAIVERYFQVKLADPALAVQAFGRADRWAQVIDLLTRRQQSPGQLIIHEPVDLQPAYIQRLIQIWPLSGGQQPTIHQATNSSSQQQIYILRARRDTDAATFLAQTLAKNPDWQPVFLIPELSRTLEQAFILEGLPAQGINSASLARPALQVLKLAPAFLWEPVDVFKIMEFLTLPIKPLDRGLSLEIARVMAEKPGLFSDKWFGAVLGYLERAGVEPSAREQYNFWFERRRYRSDTTCPKRDAVAIYAYLQQWAHDYFEQTGSRDTSLLVLAEQARRICELLEALPETRLTALDLERIVRTIYEPAPAEFDAAEVGHYPFVHQPGALLRPVNDLIWWNCLYENDAPPPDFWQPAERDWLTTRHCAPDLPQMVSQRRMLARQRAVQAAQQRLILVVPDQADGAETVPSLLLGDIQALYPNYKEFTYCIDNEADRIRLSAILTMPDTARVRVRTLTRPRAQLRVPPVLSAADLQAGTGEAEEQKRRMTETPTNLEQLFYYPHRWYFRQKTGLYPSNLLSVKRDNTLLGILAHRFFEDLLREDFASFDRTQVHDWVEAAAPVLLEKEGATLLLYGREPERKALLQKVKNAAWSLISILRSNGWQVHATEMELTGHFAGIAVRGKADLVVQRGREMAIIDLKWGGSNHRKSLIASEEDIQLALYAHLLPPPEIWPHTAYFILEQGQLIARNNTAFKEAVIAGKGEPHEAVYARMLQRMEKTFVWRMEQLERGVLEIRTDRTANELAALYEDEPLMELLEMKTEPAKWDDYQTLIEFMG